MKLKIFQIDSFTNQVFAGNPAGVCPLPNWLDDTTLQNIATEMNLSETCFFVSNNGAYEIRWMTPTTEVNLCGHATLAAAWVIFNELGEKNDLIRFSSKSGELGVRREGQRLTLDFPADVPKACEIPRELLTALGVKKPVEILAGADYVVVLESEEDVRAVSPVFSALLGLPLRGVIVTAQGKSVDFVSRWFGPNVGVDEDPVTGSAHTMLAPYWAMKLKKNTLLARQISKRGGELECHYEGERVFLTGSAVKFLEGNIEVTNKL